jgi:hypothetical protein
MRRATVTRPAWWNTVAVAFGAGLLAVACGSGGGLYGGGSSSGDRHGRRHRIGKQPAGRDEQGLPVRIRLTRHVTAARKETAMDRYPNISDHGLIGDLHTPAGLPPPGPVP